MLAEDQTSAPAKTLISAAQEANAALAEVVMISNQHEAAFEEQQARKRQAFDQYEQSLLRENRSRWIELREEEARRRTKVEQRREELASIVAKTESLVQALQGLMPPDRINGDLRNYLGHDEIRFESNDAEGKGLGYRIVRSSGKPVEDLSEGERTAIAFLHFLRDCASVDIADAPDLVILDDPVTSLDDSALYTAHAFIRSSLERANNEDGPTVVILTHRHSYFRLLVDWHNDVNKTRGPEEDRRDRARLIETLAVFNDGDRECLVREMPESLATAGSEYALLLTELIDLSSDEPLDAHCGENAPLEVVIQPNLARRVLEGFLSFKYAGTRRTSPFTLLENVLRKAPDDDFGADRQARLKKLLNAGSHGESLVDTYEAVASHTEIRLVVQDVLDLIEALDPDHFASFAGN